MSGRSLIYRARNPPALHSKSPYAPTPVAAERSLGKGRQARRQTVAGLRIALEHRIWQPAILSLQTATLLLADEGEPEHAAELDTLVERERADSHSSWAMTLWGRELAAAALGADAAAAQERGRVRDLCATARELLAQLEAAGWDAAEPAV
jgi:hypothetical protein